MKRTAISFAAALLLLMSTVAHAQIFPLVTLSPDPLDFPDTRVSSTSASMTITATATGGSVPTYIFGTRLGDTTNFSITNDQCTDVALSSGDSCTVDIAFTPQAIGQYTSGFALISLSQTIISSSTVTGKGVEPRVTLSTTSIDFGDQTVGKSSTPHEVLMVNSGNTALSITSIQPSANFGVTDNCGTSLAAEGSCDLFITFTPPSAGPFTGTVTITDDASDSPQTINLSGTGIVPGQPDVSLSRHEIDFGNQLAGTTSAAEQVTLKNTGTVNLTINSITSSANFAETDDCVSPIAPDATCTLDITFSPNAAGAFSGTITITDDATDSPQTIDLTGVGIENAGPQASFSATSLDFGNQTVNTVSTPQTVTVTNTGDENLEIDEVVVGGDNPEDFSVQDTCHESTIAPNRTCDIHVTFGPLENGDFTATITVTDNATNNTTTITLTGSGISSGGSGSNCSLAASNTATGVAPLALMLIGLLAMRRRKG
jgi:hypothetical protein